MDENRVTRSIPCSDVAGRSRSLQVVGEPGRICISTPAGEFACIDPRQHDALKTALLDALVVAVRGV